MSHNPTTDHGDIAAAVAELYRSADRAAQRQIVNRRRRNTALAFAISALLILWPRLGLPTLDDPASSPLPRNVQTPTTERR
jgi:hypothetical protein